MRRRLGSEGGGIVDREEAVAVLDELLRRSGKLPRCRWWPHMPFNKQQEFLALTCKESLYGGSAGGGKSDALLMAVSEPVDYDPNYSGLLLRKSYQDLAKPGAVMDRSKAWWQNTAAHWSEKNKTWTFPSGARLSFGYLKSEQDKYQYQSAEFQRIAYDELTQFPETQYTYLLSRLRRSSDGKTVLRQMGATNPGGRGHNWVKRRFIDPATSKGRAFVPSTLDDNVHVDRESYIEVMQELDEVTRMQLLDGVWVRDDGGLIYKYAPERNAIDEFPPGNWSFILGIDLGASQSKPTTAFSIVAFSKQDKRAITILSYARAAMIPSTIAEEVFLLQDQVGGFEQIVVDAGALGAGYVGEMQQRYRIPAQPAQKANKLGYRKLYNGDLERGEHLIVEHACADLIAEYNEITWNDAGTDGLDGQANHCSDADLYAWRAARHWLAKEPENEPKRGTAEHAERQAQRMKADRIKQLREKRKQPWKRQATV